MVEKPNILFFFADDQRFDTIAALGNREIKTPNIDQLVKNGVTFTQAHIPGGTVSAVCMPSRAMLHTGRTLFNLQNDGEEIPQDHILLGEVLQKAGYRTFGTGKWHNGPEAYARSFTDGDEIFFGGMGDHWNVPANHFDPEGKYDQRQKIIQNPYFSNKVITNICDHVHAGKHSSELFCETASKWLENYDNQQPFFMYISFMAPHDPRSMPEEFLNMYDPEKIKLPENFRTERPFDYEEKVTRDENLAAYPRKPEEIKRHIAEYYGMISHLDNELGKVIKTLKEKGLYDKTIIIFSADNGLAVGEHGLMGKQNNYEHSIRVPLIFSGPGIPQNEQRDSYVYLLDIYPTLCDMVGIPIPDSVDGVSFLPVIYDKRKKARTELYFAYGDLIRSIKDERYKLIEYRNKVFRGTELFDLKGDPYEMNNLYGKAGYKEEIEKLRAELKKYCSDWNDKRHPKGKEFWERY